jgi:OOP family OmpA-OmpF porin
MNARGLIFAAIIAVAAATTAKADIIFDDTTGIGLEPNGTAFMNGLYQGYEALSKERTWATDLVDGEHFNHKARRAYRRSSVIPDAIMDRNLLEDDAAELAAALERLRNAYDRGGRTVAPVQAASAQVSYDCWIEAAEGANPNDGLLTSSETRRADVARCKGDFNAAISRVEEAANFRLTEVAKAEPKAAAAPAAMAAPKPFVVFFAWDKFALDSSAIRIIDDAVATANKHGIVDFSVTGHADRSGPEEYNLGLSLRRASAVRDALIERGVKSSGISLAGRGEAEPAVPTDDGVREPANRRVEIILL